MLGVVIVASPALLVAERLTGREFQSLPLIGLMTIVSLILFARVAASFRESARLRYEIGAQNERLAEAAAIVESTDDSITATSLDGTILSWNRASERLYGYTAEEMVGTGSTRSSSPSVTRRSTRLSQRSDGACSSSRTRQPACGRTARSCPSR